MNDNWLSTIAGSISSLLAMITGIIQVTTLMEVALYGLIGGALGYLGKWIVQIIRFHLEKRFKRN